MIDRNLIIIPTYEESENISDIIEAIFCLELPFEILIVDDNKINQLVTQKFIERYGGKGITVGGGSEAIEILESLTPNLILMDINMPQMNGFETTEIIKMKFPHIPVVALTAVEKEKVVGEHNFHLMDDIIIKPFRDTDFISIACAAMNTATKSS